MTDFVAAVVPAALPDHAGRLLIAAAAAPPIPDWLTPFPPNTRRRRVAEAGHRPRGLAHRRGALALDAATSDGLQTLLDDPATTASALPIVGEVGKGGALSAKAETTRSAC